MTLSMIIAIAENGVIGNSGALPWRLSADLQRFKRITMGHSLIMGRKTFESIGRVLPGRTSIVITRQQGYDAGGLAGEQLSVAHSLDEALRIAEHDAEVFVIGGAEIYRQAWDRIDRLYLTRVHAEVDGDTTFKEFDLTDWRLREKTRHAADAKNQYEHSFQVYERNRKSGTPDVNAATGG